MSDADINGSMLVQRPAAAASHGPAAKNKDEEFTFGDFLSVINPLQHLPIVSTIYRSLTGDEIKPAARMMGGALYGGPIGLLSALANNIAEAETGKDIGANVMSAMGIDGGPDKAKAVAEATPTIGESAAPEAGLAAGDGDGMVASSGSVDAFAGLRAAGNPEPSVITPAVERVALNAPSAKAAAASPESPKAAASASVPAARALPNQADPFAFAYGKVVAQETGGAPAAEAPASVVARLPSDPREVIAVSKRDADAFAALRAGESGKTVGGARSAPVGTNGDKDWFNSAFSRGYDKYRKAAPAPQALAPEAHLNLTI